MSRIKFVQHAAECIDINRRIASKLFHALHVCRQHLGRSVISRGATHHAHTLRKGHGNILAFCGRIAKIDQARIEGAGSNLLRQAHILGAKHNVIRGNIAMHKAAVQAFDTLQDLQDRNAHLRHDFTLNTVAFMGQIGYSMRQRSALDPFHKDKRLALPRPIAIDLWKSF